MLIAKYKKLLNMRRKSLSSSCANPLSKPTVTPPVYGKVFNPKIGKGHPAILMLHGAGGLSFRDYNADARHLADRGYVVLVLNYHEKVGSIYTFFAATRVRRWKKYRITVKNAIDYLKSLPNVQSNEIGIIGFSMGAALALSTAGNIENVNAVVIYYGSQPESKRTVKNIGNGNPLNVAPANYLARLPPVLILHGSDDTVVKAEESKTLFDRLKKMGKIAELHIYPGEKHRFSNEDAEQQTFRFLTQYIKGFR